MTIGLAIRVVALGPGVVVHELGHWLLCKLSGVQVRQVVLFRLGSPAGFVTHAAPRLLRQHFAIAGGPLVVSTSLAVALFVLLARLMHGRSTAWWPAAAALLLWLGCSVALEAWPSMADAASLRKSALLQLRQLNPGAIVVLPVSWAISLVSASRRFGGHWAYAGMLALATMRLVGA